MKPEQEVETWNNTVNVGDAVEYHEVMPVSGKEKDPIYTPLSTTTRSEAFVLGGHTAVVQIKGKSGCVCLSHCRPIK